MIGYLEGTVLARLDDGLLLRTAGGVGYHVRLPIPLLADLPAAGAPLTLHVFTVVREAEISLYGFADAAARRLFELLVTKASGVGPKLALAFLSAFEPEELRRAIVQQDVALLATIPGVGKKTATRLCLELTERLGRETFALPGSTPGGAATGTGSGDLLSALTNLGYPEKDVVPILRQLAGEDLPFADKLKQALRLLSRR